jgi:1-acyl-sn-glycerol-3-phosphate acyltransferase
MTRGEPMNFVYYLGWLFYRTLYATYFRWRVFNAERVPLKGPIILAANHASYLDPPLVGSGVHRGINYLARDTLFRFPGIGWLATLELRSREPRRRRRCRIESHSRSIAGRRRHHSFPGRNPHLMANCNPPRIGLTVNKSTAMVVPARAELQAYGLSLRFAPASSP